MAKSWSERGSAAVDAGDLETAKQCFARAVKDEPGSALHRYHLSIVLEAAGELGPAAEQLAHALRLDPNRQDAAARLAALFRRPTSTNPRPARSRIDRVAERAAYNRVDQKAIANAVVRYFNVGPMAKMVAVGRSQGWGEAARALCLRRSGELLKDELFLELLRTSVLSDLDLERLLTAVRRILLLELPPERFADRALIGFSIALMQQCWINQFVWSVSKERHRLARGHVANLEEDGANWQAFLLHCLCRPLAQVPAQASRIRRSRRLRPRALREAVAQRMAMENDERAGGDHPYLGRSMILVNLTEVASFYEASPYPRWSSVIIHRNYRARFAHFLGGNRADFLQRPFEVLIAGCGTGQQVVQSALQYGTNAKVLALDLSAASLGYASRMADAFGAGNVEFVRGDLGQVETFGPRFAGRFQVIERLACWTLSMAEPFKGWKALLKSLAPGGFMRLGLCYSATARRHLTALRGDPAYPGPGCDDPALRVFRQALMERDDELARNARKFVDFWDTQSFRDMLLHVSEQTINLPEIASFLQDEGLTFRGFQLAKESQVAFWQRFPAEVWPGALQNWAAFEENFLPSSRTCTCSGARRPLRQSRVDRAAPARLQRVA